MVSEVVVGEFIDAVVLDQEKAGRMLNEHSDLRDARWVHEGSLVDFLAIEGFIDGVKWLLNHGFDVNLPDKFGDTAIVHAIQLGNLDIAQLLVSFGADCSIVSPTLGNLLEVAIIGGDDKVIEFVESVVRR